MLNIRLLKQNCVNKETLSYLSGRQPVVSMIESALDRCSADWKVQNAELNTKLDQMLNLQEQHLQLDREHLEFEREMAGLPKSKPKVSASRKRKKGK